MMKVIKPTGPCPACVMLIGERGGIEEARRGTVFCGKSGMELDRYLLTCSGIDRASVRVTNLVKDYRDGDNPEQWEVERDLPLVQEEIQECQPLYIGLVGAWSARAFLGSDFEMDWGYALKWPKFWYNVMPLIHPAAGLHQASQQAKIAYGFTQFGKMCRGEHMPTGHLTVRRQHTYSEGVTTLGEVVAMDTEGTVERPWGLSYSSIPNVASVQRVRARKHRKWDCAAMAKALVVMHGAMHDLPVLARMGVRPQRWTDTLLMAALLGTEPHGLKALARRHLGLQLQDYSDVVADAQREKALQYLSDVVEWVQEHTV